MTNKNTKGRKSPEAVKTEILTCLKELFILCNTKKPFRISDQTRGVCSGTSMCSAILNLRIIERSYHVKDAGNMWVWQAGAPDTVVDAVYEAAKKVQKLYAANKNKKPEDKAEERDKQQTEEVNEKQAEIIAHIPQDIRRKIEETHSMVTYLYHQFAPIGKPISTDTTNTAL